MRILFSSMSFPGHINPVLPYAKALMDQGHDVRYCAPGVAADKVAKFGLTHVPSPDTSLDEIVEAFAGTEHLSEDDKDAIIIPRCFVEMAAARALPTLQQEIEAWKPDLVDRKSCEFAALIAAEEAGVPHVRVAILHGDMEQKFARLSLSARDALAETVGLSGDNGAALEAEQAYTSFPVMLGTTRVSDRAPEPFRVRLPKTDPSDSDAKPSWAPADGEPLVYVTFGTQSGTNDHERAMYRTALDAVADLPVRVLLTTGPNMAEHPLGNIPDNVTVETYVPQDQVFERCKVVVTHGGSGTVLGAMSAGLPMVVAPMFADQPNNARSVEAAGCGVAVFDATVESLKAGIENALDNTALSQAALIAADQMSSYPGIDKAVQNMLEHAACAR